MPPPHQDPSPESPPAVPLLAFLLWAAAALAYPAFFLVDLARIPGLASAAFLALPSVLGQGLLHLPIVLLSALLWAVAIGAGMALLKRAGFAGLTLGERVVFGGALGMGIFSIGTFLLGSLSLGPSWLLPVLGWGLVAAMAAVGGREFLSVLPQGFRGANAWCRRASGLERLLVVLAGLLVFLALTRMNVPVFADYDSLEYHLAAPAAWWRVGHVTFLRDLVYTNFPLNTEMLFLLAMGCFGGPATGAVVGLQVCVGFVVLAAAGVVVCGRRCGSPEAGRAGALLLLTTPLLAELVTLNSYVTELPLAAYGFLALFAFLLWRRAETPGDRRRYAALCGAMAGLAIGCKYPALLFVLAPLGAFILGCGVARPATFWRSVRSAAIVGVVALAVASPWLVRNAVNTGNPLYPLLYHTFGGSNWSPEQEAKFETAHRSADTRFFGLSRRFWQHTVWRDQPSAGRVPPASPVLLLFALLPIALGDRRSTKAILYASTLFLLCAAAMKFAPDRLGALQAHVDVFASLFVLALVTAPAFLVHRPDVLFLPLHAVVWMMAWYALTHRLDRFLDPVSPQVALLAGMGVAALGVGLPQRLGRLILAGGLVYVLLTTFLLHAPVMWVGLGEPTDSFLRKACEGSTYSQPAMEAINKLPPESTVLFLGEARTFYCERRMLAASVFDRGPIDRLLDADPPGQPVARVRDGLKALGVTHLYVNWPELGRLASSYTYRHDGREHKGLPIEAYGNLITAMMREGVLQAIAVFGSEEGGRTRPEFVVYELR